ncbi:MAG: hypothetical protein V5A48_12325 [Salinivenus sp.]
MSLNLPMLTMRDLQPLIRSFRNGRSDSFSLPGFEIRFEFLPTGNVVEFSDGLLRDDNPIMVECFVEGPPGD